MSSESALRVIQQMAADLALDFNIVSLLSLHFDHINSLRIAAQAASMEEYRQFVHTNKSFADIIEGSAIQG